MTSLWRHNVNTPSEIEKFCVKYRFKMDFNVKNHRNVIFMGVLLNMLENDDSNLQAKLRVVEWVALIRFLFGICGIINQH